MGYDLEKIPLQTSPHSTYQDYLDADTREVPGIFREVGNAVVDIADVSKDRYVDRDWYEREREVWEKTWQVACREEHIPEPGDYHVYDIGKRSWLIARNADGSISANANTCLHRGRKLRLESGHADEFRCPFHGFTWSLAGELAHIPCEFDFPQIDKDNFNLHQAQVGTWSGWVFINPDPDAMPLEDYLDPIRRHYEPYKLDQSFLGSHVAKVLDGNWKIIQEAFMESFHSLDTHPQIVGTVDDFGCQYDVWEGKPHVNRMLVPFASASSYVIDQVTEQDVYDDWTGRKELGQDDSAYILADGETARQATAKARREACAAMLGEDMDHVSDAEAVDGWYYNVFPNLMFWGGYGPNMWYRFTPWKDSHEQTLMEVGFLLRHPLGQPKPPPAEMTFLSVDQKWSDAEELGGLGFVLDQDTTNMAAIQQGLNASYKEGVTLASYQENRIRHFHQTLDSYMPKK
ncbi:MAG: aromatic ring-hydroxylating dioxygenase subunit alpha [Alphaproteobacteria bacterium]|nr:MAG: aromatic ring-hydroxylating dioxygenase subunit alpha [Alphaproteobacteria bacterium]